jgi:hypothetical protein
VTPKSNTSISSNKDRRTTKTASSSSKSMPDANKQKARSTR